MIRTKQSSRRDGSILVMTVVCLIALVGFVALAIDLGMMAVARSQAQNAADSAAMAGVRALNGDVANNNNYTAATPAALNAATANDILAEPVDQAQVTIQIGSYSYDRNQDQFMIAIPKVDGDNWSLVRATVAATRDTAFARVFGINAFNTTAMATAAHRPRDVAVVLDFSGSMRFDSLLGIPYYGARTMSNNPETVYPLFGHYSNVAGAALCNPNSQTTINGKVHGSANVTVPTAAGEPIVDDFYQNAQGGSPVKAFTSALDSYATAPGGDNFLRTGNNNGVAYAQHLNQVTGNAYDSNFETNGYSYYTGQPFNGYTQGPRYWGKTFFIWPPDPRSANDWRKKFFYTTDGVTPLDDNSQLWDSSGNWRVPRSSSTNNFYRINYNAILQWIKASPTPFPTRLRAGRILYYDAIPSTIDLSTFPPTDMNQRFWKDYIDYVLGVQQTGGSGNSPVYQKITQYTGYGDDFTWGSIRVNSKPSDGRYMDYLDNPKRPKLRMWFGPMTMLDFLGNYNLGGIASPNWKKHWWWPGTTHESPMFELKIGIQAALRDIERNHPNDFVSTMYFATPENSAGSPGLGRFNRVRTPMGRDYTRMIDALWYPPSTLDSGTEIRPYDYTNNHEAPRAMGGTCPAIGFMLAYNQFSSNSALQTYASSPSPPGEAGGFGRRGAQKLVILETDGMANVPASASFVNAGPYTGYYAVRQPGEYPQNSGTVTTQIYDIVDQITALDTNGGFSTARKPVQIHCLAFGTLFEPSTTDPDKQSALDLLQTIQYKGATQNSPSTPLADYKRIVGTSTERIDKLRDAFRLIMQDGVQVSLIE